MSLGKHFVYQQKGVFATGPDSGFFLSVFDNYGSDHTSLEVHKCRLIVVISSVHNELHPIVDVPVILGRDNYCPNYL